MADGDQWLQQGRARLVIPNHVIHTRPQFIKRHAAEIELERVPKPEQIAKAACSLPKAERSGLTRRGVALLLQCKSLAGEHPPERHKPCVDWHFEQSALGFLRINVVLESPVMAILQRRPIVEAAPALEAAFEH